MALNTNKWYVINVTKNLNLKPYKDSSLTNINAITSNFDNHISIGKTKKPFPNIVSGGFNFQEVSREDVNMIRNKFECKKNPQLMGLFQRQF